MWWKSVVWTNGEKCLIVNVLSFVFKQIFHCAMSSRAKEEGLMLEFRDQFKGNDDKIWKFHEQFKWLVPLCCEFFRFPKEIVRSFGFRRENLPCYGSSREKGILNKHMDAVGNFCGFAQSTLTSLSNFHYEKIWWEGDNPYRVCDLFMNYHMTSWLLKGS
jgi:hypothetical protein